jgi:hypothetical protein
MYSWQHFVWLGISIILIGLCFYIFRFNPKTKKMSLTNFLYFSSAFVFIQELIQMMAMMNFLPYAYGNEHNVGGVVHYAPYFDPRDFPLHLCSIQFIFLFLAARQKDENKRKKILSFFFPTATFGAFIALAMSNVFTIKNDPNWMSQCFISPVFYSFFLIHAYLLFCGIFIATDKRIDFHFKDCLSGMFTMECLGFFSLMVNSAVTVVNRDPNNYLTPTEIVSNANLFFTSDLPIDIVITEKWQWILYFTILFILVICVFVLFFLPFYFLKDRKNKKKNAKSDVDVIPETIESPDDFKEDDKENHI